MDFRKRSFYYNAYSSYVFNESLSNLVKEYSQNVLNEEENISFYFPINENGILNIWAHKKLSLIHIYVTHDQTEAMTLGTRIVVMNAGVVQQVDTPRKLYDEPCNLFVAGFIGSPQMNFLDAKCEVTGDKVLLNVGPAKIELPPAKAKKLIDGGYAGKTVVLGIRPEDCLLYTSRCV